MRKICYVSSQLCKNAKKSFMYIKNSENTHFGQFSNDTLLFYANRNKAEPREVTKQVVWIILRNRIFHRTIRNIRSGFPSYARTLCALTLFAYALKTCCILGPQNWLKVLILLPTSSCLLPVQLAGVKCQKKEINK